MGRLCKNQKHMSNEFFYCVRKQVAVALFLDLNGPVYSITFRSLDLTRIAIWAGTEWIFLYLNRIGSCGTINVDFTK